MADDTTDRTTDLTKGPLEDGPFGDPIAEPVDEDEIERELDEAFPPPRDLSRQASLVSAGLTVVAGILCVFAPFRAVYTLRAGGISASFDGWGRYDLASGSQHGPRYGVALTVAAVVLVIAAASRLRDLRPVSDPIPDQDGTVGDPARSGDERLAAGIGIAGSALLLGVLAAVALNVESTVSNASSIAASGGTSTAVDVGGMLWILVGAWVVSVLALYVPWYEARRRG